MVNRERNPAVYGIDATEPVARGGNGTHESERWTRNLDRSTGINQHHPQGERKHVNRYQRAVAIKNVTRSEDHLHDQHPMYPMMPASLIIEGMAQTAGILAGQNEEIHTVVFPQFYNSGLFTGTWTTDFASNLGLGTADTVPEPAALTSPEPATLALMGLAGTVLILRRRHS